jgi:hypothetical protein
VINPVPFVAIYPVPGDTICQGSTVTFVALPANAGANVTYRWTRNSSTTILGTNNTFTSTTINNNDVIRCEMTEPDKCGISFKDTSNEIKMNVLPWLIPSVSITSDPATPLSPYELVKFTAVPVNGGLLPKYQWKRNGNDVIGAISNVWSTQQLYNNDTISVVLTSSYKCPQPATTSSNKIKVVVLTGIENAGIAKNILIYPNPTGDVINISGIVKNGNAFIYNTVGQKLIQQEIKENTITTIDASRLTAGNYLLHIKTEWGTIIYTIIKQ